MALRQIVPILVWRKAQWRTAHMVFPRWVAFVHFVGWDNINLGLSINWRNPNLELHLPFVFVKVGRECLRPNTIQWTKGWGWE